MRSRGACSLALFPAAILLSIIRPAPAAAQGARSAAERLARRKSLADLTARTDHCIPDLRRDAIGWIAPLGHCARSGREADSAP